MLNRLRPTLGLVCAVALFGCDKKDEAAKKDDKKADKAGQDKADEPKPDDKDEGVDKDSAEKHFDVTHDKSGVLARTATVLETDDRIDSEALQELSHHAEDLPSVEEVCRHEHEVDPSIDEAACITDMEHHIVQIGPELYKDWAECLNAAATVEAIKACNDAEAEIERELHIKPHGDGLDEETCASFFDKFEELSMADAGDDGELVKEILEEVKADVLTTCGEQGTQKEVDCVHEASDMAGLKECGSSML